MSNVGVDDLVESDCSHQPEAANTENGFGVSVDLSQYFSDERARVFVWARRGRRVRWLQLRLQRRLRLPAAPALLTPLGLLLPHDPLALLRPRDTIRAIPAKKEWFNEETDNDNQIETNATESNIYIDQSYTYTEVQNKTHDEVNHEINTEVEHETYTEVETATHNEGIDVDETDNDIKVVMVKNESTPVDKLEEMKNRAMALLESCFPLGVPTVDLQSADDEEIEDESCQSELEPGERPRKRKKKRTGKRRNRAYRPNRVRPNKMVNKDGLKIDGNGAGEKESAGANEPEGCDSAGGVSAPLQDLAPGDGGGIEENGGGGAVVGGGGAVGDGGGGAVGDGGGRPVPVLLNAAQCAAAAPRLVHALS